MNDVEANELSFFLHSVNNLTSSGPKTRNNKWIKQAEWEANEQTLKLILVDAREVLEQEMELFVFLPGGGQAPFCYCGEESSAGMATLVEEVNSGLGTLPPQASLLQIADVIMKFAEKHHSSVWSLASDKLRLVTEQKIIGKLSGACNREGLDMIVSLIFYAMSSYRRHSILVPFPPQHGSGDNNDVEALERALLSIPALKELSGEQASDIITALPLAAVQILQWTMQSLPASLEMLASIRELEKMAPQESGIKPNEHRSLFKYKPGHYLCPSLIMKVRLPQDLEFETLAKKYGTKLAYHGSPTENFHSILHNGLKNMSGTRHMKTGAAFGDGIYLAQDLKVSHSYTKSLPSAKGWNKSVFCGVFGRSEGSERGKPTGKTVVNCSCIMACEVIDHPDNKLKLDENDGKGDESYYIVSNGRHVRNKYLLLYQDEMQDSSFTMGGLQWLIGALVALAAIAACLKLY
jgi:hypothetical protein